MKVAGNFKQLKQKRVQADLITYDCNNEKRKYEDTEFPPSKSSLSLNFNTTQNMDIWEVLEWKRATEIIPLNSVAIFPEFLFANSVRPGILKNPYFASALSIIAERPRILAKIFAKFEVS